MSPTAQRRSPGPAPDPSDAARPSLRAIFDAELGFVWSSLRRFGVEERDLEDVAHEVFVVVHRHLAELDPSRPVRPWLFAIAVRCASDYRRRSHRRHETLVRPGDDPVDRADPTPDAEARMIGEQQKDLARRALDRVPEERRAVIVLHDLEGVAMQDVADAFGIPLKTAYSRLRVGRDELLAAARRMLKEAR
jgi:RNA polymerase sigma-70 factor (ECF subfamily)